MVDFTQGHSQVARHTRAFRERAKARNRYEPLVATTSEVVGVGPSLERTKSQVLASLLHDRWAQAVIALFVVGYSLSTLLVHRVNGYSTFWDGWIEDVAFALPIIPMVLRARRSPSVRTAWLFNAAGVALNLVATLVYTLHDQNMHPMPNPAPSDYFHLASDVAFIVGVALLTQGRLGRGHVSVRLDGVITGLAMAALAGALFFEPVLHVSGRPAQVIVTLAYPLCDLVVLTLLIAGLAPNRYRPNWSTALLMAGVLWFVVGDVVYLNQSANGTYTGGTFLDATWVIGYWMIGLAASTRDRRSTLASRARVETSLGIVLVPVGSGLLAIGVIGVAFVRQDRSWVVLTLALAALGVMIGRMWMTLVEERRMAATSKKDAHTDALTGLANRRSLLERVDENLDEDSGQKTGVILIDLDGFKEVNDALGHIAGDELLSVLARRFENRLGGRGMLARLGGDEFAFTDFVASEEELVGIARELLEVMIDPCVLDGVSVRVNASMGAAVASSEVSSEVELLRRADVAMYEAKRAHTGVSAYRLSSDSHSREHLLSLGDLQIAIDARAVTVL